MRLLAEQGNVDQALRFSENNEERIAIYQHANDLETARDVARDVLWDQRISDVEVRDEQATVYLTSSRSEDATTETSQSEVTDMGPFVGYHTIRTDTHGDPIAVTMGTYTHQPTGVTFEAECPEHSTLRDHVRRYSHAPDRGDAARAEYRRTRL